MTTPRSTPFPTTTPRAGVLVSFVIISDSDVKITTLPVRPTPPSSDRIPSLSSYLLDSGDDSSEEDLSETAESLHTQTALTSVVHPPSTRPLPTNPAFARKPGKEISMPLGNRAAIDRWRAATPSSYHPLLLSEIPSSSPPSLFLSSSLPPPSHLPSLSRKRSRLPSPSLLPSVSPSPLPSPPPEHIESVGDDIETLRASLASAMIKMMTLHARVRLLEQHDVVTRDLLRITRGRITWSQLRVVYAKQEVRELQEFRVTDRLEIIELRSRAEYVESCLEQSHKRQTGDGARMIDMTEQDIEALRARAEAVEQRAEILQYH
ncbi:hypothetical protein Tco_0356816 [Tanacetum coccineum]